MATIYWDGGAGDNVFSTAANWSGDVSPTTGDVCILGEDPSDGIDNIVGGDQTALGALTLIVGPKWTGDIGTTVQPLQLKLTRIEYNGIASVCHVFADSSTTVASCLVVDTGVGEMPFRLTGTATVTSLQVTGNRGQVRISGGRTVVNAEMIGNGVNEVVLGDAAVVSGTSVNCNAGTLKINGNFATVDVSERGTVEVSETPTVTDLNIFGGSCRWLCTGTTSAISGSVNVYSGLFDISACPAATVTVTGAVLYEQGTIDERNGLGSVTWSGGIDSRGGTIYPDSGRTLTVA